jgi:N utilization substance protein B
VVGARRAARRLALDVLYEAEMRDRLPAEALAARLDEEWSAIPGEGAERVEDPTPEALDYAGSLVRGVQEHQADIDALIAAYADRWALRRMPVIDRNLLRIGVLELLWGDDIPVAVAINEAVELAKSLSTEESGRFVNGLLGRIAQDRRTG